MSDNELRRVNYPKQVYSAKRASLVFGVDNFLSTPQKRDEVPSLEMHSPFSRYIATIIDKSGPKVQTPKANIPAGDVPGIVEIGKAAMREHLSYSGEETAATYDDERPSAYTQTIPFGIFKGKSPAAVLLENPENKTELAKTCEIFQKNVSKYPQNQKQIDAINGALKLLATGLLKREDAAQMKTGMMTVYNVSHKYMSDTNAQGHRLFYGMSIECWYGNNYPWVITIENFFAPGLQNAKGGLTPKLDEKNSCAKGVIRLNDMEWSQFMIRLELDLKNFEAMWYRDMYKEAVTIDTAHREARKAAQEQKTSAA